MECAIRCAAQSAPGYAPRKKGPGGRKDAIETIFLSTRFRIATWRPRTDSDGLKTTERPLTSASEYINHIDPLLLMRVLETDSTEPAEIYTARWQRCNDEIGHILRLTENRVIRRVLTNCVRPTPGSLFGDVPDLDSGKTEEIAKGREKVE